MLKHTKIVATVSDQRCDVAFVEALYKAGMNVVRLNTAHMMEEGLTRVVNNVRTVSDRIGILMDTKGPDHDDGKQGTDPFQDWRDREGNR